MKLSRKQSALTQTLAHPGFTLVEMLIVLVILSTLAAIVYPSYTDKGLRARRISARTQLKIFKTALAAFEMDNDHFPPGRNGLQDLIQRPRDAANWRGPYLDGGVPKDPWGHDYLYDCPGKHNQPYDIICSAQDGLQGTDDDITTWQQDNQ